MIPFIGHSHPLLLVGQVRGLEVCGTSCAEFEFS